MRGSIVNGSQSRAKANRSKFCWQQLSVVRRTHAICIKDPACGVIAVHACDRDAPAHIVTTRLIHN
jgi:hypothetical protein